VLDPGRAAHVGAEIAALVARIAPAGALNGLAQAVLRMTAPGIPDLYQGSEYWDFSLVDPDNRRPVDFPAREASLAASLASDAPAPDSLMPAWRDGRVKQAVIARVLALRARAPELFTAGAAAGGGPARRARARLRPHRRRPRRHRRGLAPRRRGRGRRHAPGRAGAVAGNRRTPAA